MSSNDESPEEIAAAHARGRELYQRQQAQLAQTAPGLEPPAPSPGPSTILGANEGSGTILAVGPHVNFRAQ